MSTVDRRTTALMRRLAAVLFAALAAGLGLTTWSSGEAATAPAEREARPELLQTGGSTQELRSALEDARRSCSIDALEAAIAAIEAHARAPQADAAAWTLLAEARLERAQRRTLLRGLTVGQPLFSELPPQLREDLDAGDAAIAEARRRGADSAASFRVEASLLSQRITGLLSALRYRGDIERALQAASARAPDDPQLLVARGLQLLLAPKLLGHDPAGALTRFERAHAAGADERAAIFAGMACWLQGEQQQALRWLTTAAEQNPDNPFARAVLARVAADETDPFGRDVSAAEATERSGR